jgi:hypothetical protein
LSFDNSRFTFNPLNDYTGVVMQQGRVQTDADWNEWLAELLRRIQAGTVDTLGRAVYPINITPNAFQITASVSGGTNQILIGAGRMYVDGLLAENHGDPSTPRWDPILGETTGAAQIDYTKQPYLPNPPAITGSDPFLAYLDVWIRPITYLDDPNLIDKAIGVDTTGRLQTVWQVKLMAVPSGSTCSSIFTWPVSSAGLLTTGPVVTTPSGPCCLSDNTGYTGQENQFYRVEIHHGGKPSASPAPSPIAHGTATFKWSRDNGSVMTGVTAIASATNSGGKASSQLTVLSLGRDQVLGFAPGNWIEILDDESELKGNPGDLLQIDTVDFAAKTITLVSPTSFTADAKLNTRIRRWDQSGKIYQSDGTTVWWDLGSQTSGDIPVPPSGTTLILENGITVVFGVDPSVSGGSFLTGDFWTFAARTADGSIEQLTAAPPRGIHHHYAPLSVVSFSPVSNPDCRTPWPPSSGAECGCCCSVTVGKGAQYSTIQSAIDALPDAGGEVCILPGIYPERLFIQGRSDVVLRGCGWQTRIVSPPPSGSTPVPAAGASGSTFSAVITVSASQHVQLRSFAVEAGVGDVGVLLDGTGNLSAAPPTPVARVAAAEFAAAQNPGVVDTTLENLVITASDQPAILAQQILSLEIEKNRIAMQNVQTTWPAVWVNGTEIRIVRNWVGLQTAATVAEWLPTSVAGDLNLGASTEGGKTPELLRLPVNPCDIQIAGPSTGVLIAENEIEGGARNGITLGSLTILDAKGNDTGMIVGVLPAPPDPCATTTGLQVSGTPPSSVRGGSVVAGGKLTNIQIDRNLIRNTRLCGIGPVGIFDLAETAEMVSIENLTISSNTILNTLGAVLSDFTRQRFFFGYGAICLPDVQNLTIRDNIITNFGNQPGATVCGIFILHGEMIDVSRNQVLDTRDFNTSFTTQNTSPVPVRGGIWAGLVTPPSFASGTGIAFVGQIVYDYEPGMPALRVEHNKVRVPLGEALFAFGFGPFSIVNNHFACGGTVTDTTTMLAQTVLIWNVGTAIEASATTSTFSGAAFGRGAGLQTNSQFATSRGTVVFTNNVCQWEAQQTNQHALSSVLILTLDSLIFSNNHCWIDGPQLTSAFDAVLLAGSAQVANNRFQESPGFPVLLSGWTFGVLNITTGNISTYCLLVEPTGSGTVNANNLSLIPCPGQ